MMRLCNYNGDPWFVTTSLLFINVFPSRKVICSVPRTLQTHKAKYILGIIKVYSAGSLVCLGYTESTNSVLSKKANLCAVLSIHNNRACLNTIGRQLFMSRRKKVLIIGLDCAPPELVFDQWRDELPNFKRVMDDGVWGKLESCIPAITVPAWSSMMSSKDPGTLGFYGFRNRGDHSYEKNTLANSSSVKTDRVWDVLSRAGKKVITVGVPQTYPPRPVNGIQVGCFLSPSTKNPDKPYTYPASAMKEIEAIVGEYLVDVPNFRTDDKEYLLRQIYTMTEKRFKLVKKWIAEKDWDFFMFVEMGTDRIHHGLWKYHDPTHHKYEVNPRLNESIHDYYRYIDSEIGQILELVDDDTTVFIVSDHGAKKMDAARAISL